MTDLLTISAVDVAVTENIDPVAVFIGRKARAGNSPDKEQEENSDLERNAHSGNEHADEEFILKAGRTFAFR